MRKKHISVLKLQLKNFNIKWIFKQIIKYFAMPIEYFIKRPFTGPIFGGLMVTYKCNMQCIMCDLWRRKVENELSFNEIKKIVDDLSYLGVSGIALSGGEPLVRKDIFDIIKYIKSKKIPVAMSTNGLLLAKKETTDILFESGIDSIALSLDSVNPELHNRLRGKKNAFEILFKAINNIVELKHQYPNVNLTLSMVISKNNINDVYQIIEIAKTNKIDGVSFLAAWTDGLEHDVNNRKNNLLLNDNQIIEVEKIIDNLISSKKQGVPIDNSINYLKSLKYYFRGKKLPFNCLASYTSLYVDANGNIYPCFAWLEQKKKLGNIRDIDIKKFWFSAKYNEYRKSINKCRDCYFPCQTEFGLLYKFKK